MKQSPTARNPRPRPSLTTLARGLLAELRLDTAKATDRPPGPKALLLGLVWSRGAQALALYRLGRLAAQAGAQPAAEVLQRIAQVFYGIDISYEADIAPGVTIRHGTGLVVGNRAKIAKDVVLFHGVTIGNRLSGSTERPDGMPTIEEGVLIGAGAAVLGPVTVGARSKIGANTVVTKDVPPGSIVTGAPPVYRAGVKEHDAS